MKPLPTASGEWQLSPGLRPVRAMLSSRYFNISNRDQMLNFGDEMLNLKYKVLNPLHN